MNFYQTAYLKLCPSWLLEQTPTTADRSWLLEHTPTTANRSWLLEQTPTTADRSWLLEHTPTTADRSWLLEQTPTTANRFIKAIGTAMQLKLFVSSMSFTLKYFTHFVIIFLFCCLTGFLTGQEGQIDIERVELMPNEPSPYFMRDWNAVATAYDSFVYDEQKTGEYLPLVFVRPQGVNYPGRESFGLDTYVGTFSIDNGEGINVLPSLVSATLAGIDKTNQFGRNWVLMSQDYFNKANGENLYLNNIGGHSGSDWWYDMMPNIYFYQLYDLYGSIGDAQNQFHQVAQRMSSAVQAMGGSATPWTRAFMDYRAWDFLNMQPNADGVHEPEAAGAYAWLLYHAYRETGNEVYLRSAEWSMEYLVNLNSNPSYELQLPYGAYAAARMNAEIGTEYNIEKLVFWIFNRGPLRGWGTIEGTWNTFDVSGLVGEANDGGNDYAFQLNGVQQAGALVPLVRYDKRFARTIGKWMVNVANATRLMYPGFLPSHLQDADTWSDAHDPKAVIGYEALREVWQGSSPFSTGDALKGTWAATNLSLYSTSSIGYMGSLIEKTNQEKILKLDLVKTDFFSDAAYPSYLLYNPYSVAKTVMINAGSEPRDIYDVVTESFLALNVSGEVTLDIPADQAVSIVLSPADGTITYEKNKMLIDGVVVDYMQTHIAYNALPRIQSFATENNTVEKNSTITLYGKGIDQETKDLIYTFILPDDTISSLEKSTTWTVPNEEGTFEIKLIIEDEDQQTDTAVISIDVVTEINYAPEIISLTALQNYTSPGGNITIQAEVTDVNNDAISYSWTATQGDIIGSDDIVDWLAPNDEGIFTIQLMVSDGRGGSALASIKLLVLNPDLHVDGDLIAWYPFQGNAQDISGNALHGQVFGAKLTEDSLGNSSSAYFFDGFNDHIRVPNQPILNFANGVTVTGFVKPEVIGDKERFILSHGSWQNRWKLSITPNRKVRWTLKNASGQVRDLDSETVLDANTKTYHIAASYNGRFLLLYINGRLESFSAFSGDINSSPFDFEIGQILPDDQMYNYRGIMDEVKIFDYALIPDSVAAESGIITTGITDPVSKSPFSLSLYPNPAKEFITLDAGGLADVPGDKFTGYILDSQGKIVWQASFADITKRKISVSSLSNGIYIMRISRGETAWTGTFVIEK